MPRLRLLICLALTAPLHAIAADNWAACSPGGNLKLNTSLDSGHLTYSLTLNPAGRTAELLAPSPLGVETSVGDFTTGLKLVSASNPTETDAHYEMSTGKQLSLRDHHTTWKLMLANAAGQALTVEFRIYDDGLAFRYCLPGLPAGTSVVGETTGFHLPAPGRAWIQPYAPAGMSSPAYEEYFTNGQPLGQDSPGREGWAFPALFQVDDSWLLITEADLDGTSYAARLDSRVVDSTYTIAPPLRADGNGLGSTAATITGPWQGAWRVVIAGPTLATIVESSLVHAVSRPPAAGDWSWVKPGRVSWSWWSAPAGPRDFDRLKTYIDLAADWGWEYSLIDANWDQMVHGNLEQIVAYAGQRGVGILLWYNSGGPTNDVMARPRDLLDDPAKRRAEFAKLEAMGVRGVKVDFFQSDKPSMIQYYIDILKDAADRHLLVDFHGCTIPRGWQRTYPNLMSMEAVAGAEFYRFQADYGLRAVPQNTVIPFTRNVIGSMDYTPVTFSDQKVPHQTSFAQELALSVLFESGVQHFADSAASYRSLPDYVQNWLKAVPVAWDETRFVAGMPSELAVLARRRGKIWYVAGIDGARLPRSLSLDLPFLDRSPHRVEIIADGMNDTSFSHDSQVLAAGAPLVVAFRPAGGFVAKISPF